jgi:prefoldin subunit 5
MKQKLEELRVEFERGQQQMSLLEQRRAEVRDTLLRISGAIQVLEDLLQAKSSPNGDDDATKSDRRSAVDESTARIPC